MRCRGFEQRTARILELVRHIRRDEPGAGTRKLHDRIKPQLLGEGLALGRDRLFKALRERALLVQPKKRYQRTTYSNHEYAVAPNRVKNLRIERAGQVLVSDITYVPLARGFAYLALVTDAFSRKILGYHLSSDLTHHSALLALDMALREVKNPRGMLHHSDRGCQYCCHEYLRFLGLHGIVPSMTDASHCYQNAIAERVNGILKLELLDPVFHDFPSAAKAVSRAVWIYNTKRTHWSLGLKTPAQVYALAA
jgi:transposase InsO family protein